MIEFLTDTQAVTDFLSTSLRLSIPIIFAAVGGVISERSGVFNIALEGCILGGAFGAAVGAYMTGTPIGGLALGVFVALSVGLILAGLAVGLAINQLVAGIAINILMLGFTSYLARLILGADAATTLPGFHSIAIPGLVSIPIIGPVLFDQDILTYLMYLLVPFSWWVIYKTPWGLNLRAIGRGRQCRDQRFKSTDHCGAGQLRHGGAGRMLSGAFTSLCLHREYERR